jgi:hypothetical protein
LRELPVGVAVEGRWPAAARALAGAPVLLVGAFGDGMPDAAAAQFGGVQR